MNTKILIALIIVITSASRLVIPPNGEIIDGQYIVVFHSNATADLKKQHMDNFGQFGEIIYRYDIKSFSGFSAKMNESVLARELRSPIIEYIEQDQEMTVTQTCNFQRNVVWGLDRISEREVELDGEYIFPPEAGKGVTAYIIDTGILIQHYEFEGRATWGANFVDSNNVDCNGHGTHVAGTVGGKTYGVAKDVSLIAVKVLSCYGGGSNSGVIKGIEWVAEHHKNQSNPSLANMSLGGGKSETVNAAVAAAVSTGVSFIVAAGNSRADACLYSPASSPAVVSVGATEVAAEDEENAMDMRSAYSNMGSCVTLFAPGTLIESAWIGYENATKTISGTSMASPHVAGVAALYLGQNPAASPEEVKTFLLKEASMDLIDMNCATNMCPQSPNLLLYSACL